MTNYQRVLDAELAKLAAAVTRPRLLLHACCAPCSSYTLEYLAAHFDITVLFYNPNIAPAAEYDFRAAELARYIAEAPCGAGVKLRVEPYDPAPFFEMALRNCPRAGNAAKNVTVCAFARRRASPLPRGLTISAPRSPSARTRTPGR